jgi:hypothetical protein
MTLEITRPHLASLQGIDGGRWPVRRIRSLCPERVHFCYYTDVVHR